MKARQSIKWACVAVVVLGLGAFGYRLFLLKPIPPHHGDGMFQDLSYRVAGVPRPGYSISFPEFDLGKEYRASFRVAKLPTLKGQGGFYQDDCGLYLAIAGTGSQWDAHEAQQKLRGSLRLELEGTGGITIATAHGALCEFTWGSWSGANRLYQIPGSFFVADGAEKYTVRITYSPDLRLSSLKGFVYLECGSHW